jgi:hypothetical protein
VARGPRLREKGKGARERVRPAGGLGRAGERRKRRAGLRTWFSAHRGFEGEANEFEFKCPFQIQIPHIGITQNESQTRISNNQFQNKDDRDQIRKDFK